MVLITSTREPNSSFCCSSVSVSPILRTSSTTPSPTPPAPWSRTTARTSSSKCSYYTRVVVLTKSAIVTVVQFLSTGFPRKKIFFFASPTLCLNSWISSAKSVLKKHLQVKLERIKKLFWKPPSRRTLKYHTTFFNFICVVGPAAAATCFKPP